MNSPSYSGTGEKQKNGEYESKLERQLLPYAFEKELIDNQNKHFHIMDTFVPLHSIHPVEQKFYSRHEQICNSPPSEHFLEFVQRPQYKRRMPNGHPLLESQIYGWPQIELSGDDLKILNFIHAPKQRCNMTVFGEALISGRITERPPFNGVRFFLR